MWTGRWAGCCILPPRCAHKYKYEYEYKYKLWKIQIAEDGRVVASCPQVACTTINTNTNINTNYKNTNSGRWAVASCPQDDTQLQIRLQIQIQVQIMKNTNVDRKMGGPLHPALKMPALNLTSPSTSAICNSIIICTIASKNNTLDQSLHFLYLCYLLFSPPESDESYARHDFCCEVQVFSAKQLSITFSSVEFFWWASGLGLFWPKRLLADPCKD